MVGALLICLWIRQQTPPTPNPVAVPDPAIGKWKAVPPAESPERWWYWTLDIREDGTFLQHRDLRIMVNILGDGKGTWRREAKGIRLTGEATESFDDGYAKSTRTMPIDDLLTEKDGKLIYQPTLPGEKVDESLAMEFRRVTTLDREPEPPPPPPDRRAEAIWAQCRKTYRGFESYRASGGGVHPGEKNRPLTARFSLSHTRASGLNLKVTDSGTEFQVHATSTSSTLRSNLSPKPSRGGRWAAFDSLFGMTSLDYGLIAELLLTPFPVESTRYRDFRFVRESVVDGVPCHDLSFQDSEGYRWIASVGKNTHLLLQVQDSSTAFRIRIKGSGSSAKASKR